MSACLFETRKVVNSAGRRDRIFERISAPVSLTLRLREKRSKDSSPSREAQQRLFASLSPRSESQEQRSEVRQPRNGSPAAEARLWGSLGPRHRETQHAQNESEEDQTFGNGGVFSERGAAAIFFWSLRCEHGGVESNNVQHANQERILEPAAQCL